MARRSRSGTRVRSARRSRAAQTDRTPREKRGCAVVRPSSAQCRPHRSRYLQKTRSSSGALIKVQAGNIGVLICRLSKGALIKQRPEARSRSSAPDVRRCPTTACDSTVCENPSPRPGKVGSHGATRRESRRLRAKWRAPRRTPAGANRAGCTWMEKIQLAREEKWWLDSHGGDGRARTREGSQGRAFQTVITYVPSTGGL